MSLAQVKKEISDTEKENELLNKHFHLMQVKRKNQLMTRELKIHTTNWSKDEFNETTGIYKIANS